MCAKRPGNRSNARGVPRAKHVKRGQGQGLRIRGENGKVEIISVICTHWSSVAGHFEQAVHLGKGVFDRVACSEASAGGEINEGSLQADDGGVVAKGVGDLGYSPPAAVYG